MYLSNVVLRKVVLHHRSEEIQLLPLLMDFIPLSAVPANMLSLPIYLWQRQGVKE